MGQTPVNRRRTEIIFQWLGRLARFKKS